MAFHYSLTRLPADASSMGNLWARLEVRIKREGQDEATRAHLHFLPWLLFDMRRHRALRGPAFEPWSPYLGSGGSSPQAPWGSVGVGRVSCVTLSSVSATGGAELMTLASMAQVSRSVSSLTGMFEQNLVPSLVTGSAKPSCGIPLLLNPPSNKFPLNGDSVGLDRG